MMSTDRVYLFCGGEFWAFLTVKFLLCMFVSVAMIIFAGLCVLLCVGVGRCVCVVWVYQERNSGDRMQIK